jgi:folate-binding protein YgfZ
MVNPVLDQRAFAAGDALVVLPKHMIFEITGVDRQAWLHAFLAQRIMGLNAGESTEALMLDASGHVQLAWRIFEDTESTWMFALPNPLYAECASAEAFETWMRANVFRKKVVIANRSMGLDVIARNTFDGVPNAVVVWKDPWPAEVVGSVRYSKTPLASLGRDYHLSESLVAAEGASKLIGLPLVGADALTALRIAAHRPSQLAEVDAKTLPHELDWLSTGVHLSKGCYRGQESVAKVHNLGHPPRRLVLLQLDGSGHFLPEVGDPVFVQGDDRQRGVVTSTAQHFEMGPIALAVINRVTDPSAILVVTSGNETIAATQEVIVPTDAGSANPRPRKSLLNGHG